MRFRQATNRPRPSLADGPCGAVRALTAYWDWNPARARLTTDLTDYWRSGYGEAVAGRESVQRGIASANRAVAWAPVKVGSRQMRTADADWAVGLGKFALDEESLGRESAQV